MKAPQCPPTSVLGSEENYRLLVESLEDYAVFMLDTAGIVASWNLGAVRIKGYRAEEIIGRHFSIFYPAKALQRGLPEAELKASAKEGRYEDEGWRVRKDGKQFWANVVITALRDKSGRLLGFSKVTRDLSDRKQAEYALQQRLAAIVESSDDAIVGKDLQGLITSWNMGAERIFGYAAGEIVGQPITRLIPSDRQHEETDILGRIQRGERVLHFDTERVRKNGSVVAISVTVSPIKDSCGKIIGASKVARDITDRRRAEGQLKSSIKEIIDLKAALDQHAIVATTHREKSTTSTTSFALFPNSPARNCSARIIALSIRAFIPKNLSTASGRASRKAKFGKARLRTRPKMAHFTGWTPPLCRSSTRTANPANMLPSVPTLRSANGPKRRRPNWPPS